MAKTKATPTEKYWKKRQEELEKKWDKKSRTEIEQELKAYYEQSLAHIEKDISVLYQRFATDNGMDMAAAQQLLTGKEYRVWRMDLDEYVKEINATGSSELQRELNTLAMRSRITRLDALRAGTLKEMAKLSEKSEAALKEFLKSGYEDFYYHGLYEIGKKRGLQGTVSLVDGEKLERILRVPWSGKNYSKRIWSNNAKLAKVIQQNIIADAHRGVSVQEMTRDVRQRMGVGTKEAVRLVRTELNYVQNQAALHSIKDAGMKFYRFIATLDKRTSTVCQSHDGDVFPVEEAMPGKNMPPLHPHCRSVISGCLKGEYKPQSGTRIARDENGKNVFVPAQMKYDDWKSVYVDKKLTLEEWKAGNGASQATNTAGALNGGAQGDIINLQGGINVMQAKKRDRKIMITDVAIDKVPCVKMPNISMQECERIQAAHKRLLRIAQAQNESNEVLAILSFANMDEIHVLGNEDEVNPETDMKARAAFLSSRYGELMYLHNHPSTNIFSMADIDTFITQGGIGLISVVTNQGEVYILHKNHRYTYEKARDLLFLIREAVSEDTEKMIDMFLRDCKKAGIDYGKAK